MDDIVHHHAVKVLIDDEASANYFDFDHPVVFEPVKRARVVTVNGEIWERRFRAFNLDEAAVVRDWDLSYANDWTKIECNKK
jgi:hypothetical protein